MLKIVIMGSPHFRMFMEEIEADEIFSNISFSFINTNGDRIDYAALAQEANHLNPDIAVIGTSDQVPLLPHLTVPSYPVHPSISDFLSLHSTITDYSTTAFVFSYPINIDFSILEKALHVNYHTFYFQNRNDIPILLASLKSQGYRTVVANNTVIGAAALLGFETRYYFSKNNIIDAVNNALHVLDNLKKESDYSNGIRHILENVTCGVICALKSDNSIYYANTMALKTLGRSFNSLVQHTISDFLQPEIIELLKNLTNVESDLQFTFGDTSVFGSICPILSAEGADAYAFFFDKTSQIIRRESIIRRNLKQKSFSTRYSFDDVIGKSNAMQFAIQQAKRFAERQSTILLQAETGTGKEVFSQSIHAYSSRKEYPFIAISCGAVPDTLIESELFGYVPGAFTGASNKGKAGLLEAANHGTVLLDDIDALSISFQAKLLRVMQEREIVRVGGNTPIPIDVRFICATNRNLKQMVESGAFRSDLYFRVNVLRLNLPPLRERSEDIPLLLKYYLERFDKDMYHAILPSFDDIFAQAFSHSFLGNVRELINYTERFTALADPQCWNDVDSLQRLAQECLDIAVDEHHFFPFGQKSISFSGNYQQDISNADAAILKHYIAEEHNISKLSERLGISRSTLYNKLKEYNLSFS